MGDSVVVVYGDEELSYDFGSSHPLRPERVRLTQSLSAHLGLLDGVTVLRPRQAAREELLLVHEEGYLEAVEAASAGESFRGRFGLGTGDNPVFPGMHRAASVVVGGSLVAAEEVLSGRALHAFHPAGGLHHAMPARASGFCIYNDAAVAIEALLLAGIKRVAYIDLDVHHGDGVERVFYSDPRVLTVSIHESGEYLFPGTGFPDENGEGEGRGYAVNLPLPPRVGDGEYLSAFDSLVPPLLEAFKPGVLVTQVGADTHFQDPLAHLSLSLRAYPALASRLHRLAHAYSGGRWICLGGGGYGWATVVPRAWASYLASQVEKEVGGELPRAWREEVGRVWSGWIPRAYFEEERDPPGGTGQDLTPLVEQALEKSFLGRGRG